jgi:hypothetical protein
MFVISNLNLMRDVRLFPGQTRPLDNVDHVIEDEPHDHQRE